MITLATLPQATAQEVFDQVKNHLLQQNAKSAIIVDGRSLCRYKGNGLKCAAGCLIGPEEYNYSFELNNWRNLRIKKKVPKEHLELIIDLQLLHDGCSPKIWAKELKVLATQKGLKYE